MVHQRTGISLTSLAWVAFILPLLTTHICYFVAASYDHIPWCFPYLDSCTSISATGRQLPEKLIFKFGMITTAFISILLWWSVGQWCRLSEDETFIRSRKSMQLLGILAALFLIQYTLALGEVGDEYYLLRRSGVVLTFSFTYISQVLLTRFIGQMVHEQGKASLAKLQRAMLVLLVTLLTTGILSLILEVAAEATYDNLDNAFEWAMALMLYSYFGLFALVLHRQPLRLKVEPAGKESM